MVDQNVRDELKSIYSKGNITLFLGAGVSAGNGLPNWNELVNTLFFRYMMEEKWDQLKPYPTYLNAVSKWYLGHLGETLDIIIRGLKTGWTEEEYYEAFWDVLYNSINSSKKYKGDNVLLNYIRNLIVDKRKKIKAVITYNYDDLLEQSLKKVNYNSYKTVYSSASFSGKKLPIYHVHGYIPYINNSEKIPFGQIVLSEEEYNTIISDSNFWGNIIQSKMLASTTNIMIGLSLTDRNLRRLLDSISKQSFASNNYIFLRRRTPPSLKESEVESIHKEALSVAKKWNLNTFIKGEEKRFTEIPQILDGIVYNYSENERRIYDQLKIKPIWYDTYEDIATYINYMYEDSI